MIMIDMNMPEDCLHCRLAEFSHDGLICHGLDGKPYSLEEERRSDCPLSDLIMPKAYVELFMKERGQK